MMQNGFYMVYALILAIVSFYTKEVVTFVMLGFILLSLNSIHATLKDIHKATIKQNTD